MFRIFECNVQVSKTWHLLSDYRLPTKILYARWILITNTIDPQFLLTKEIMDNVSNGLDLLFFMGLLILFAISIVLTITLSGWFVLLVVFIQAFLTIIGVIVLK